MTTKERLQHLFNIHVVDGFITYRQRSMDEFPTAACFGRHCKRVGNVAGCIEAQGYRVVVVDGVKIGVHRLIWFVATGDWPVYPQWEIDHINGDRSDNRISNLRKVRKSDNQRNGSLRVTNSSGVNGVNWVASKRRWVARIWDGPRHRYLGMFKNIEDARQARIRAERELSYHEGHGKRTLRVLA